jgi:hypothetical protein
MPNPAIILIDNDDGVKEIFASARNLGMFHISRSPRAHSTGLPPISIETPEIGAKCKATSGAVERVTL